ncbi:heart- and neural crest derivative [Cricetulus griseus]|nr:heart- and neural crest derivative [Cricetulus griseus]
MRRIAALTRGLLWVPGAVKNMQTHECMWCLETMQHTENKLNMQTLDASVELANGPGQSPGRLEALGGRLPRRKGSGPKKERRRTESINSAFAELRECIPNVPADTKLSKIKTLRLATSYIAYLMDVLAKDAQAGDPEAFKAELKKADGGRESKRKRELPQHEGFPPALGPGEKRIKGRTGWPQQVWALELNQ